jgi:hypothetical protein
MKKSLLASAITVLLSANSFAGASDFEGLSATLGLGYQSYKPEITNYNGGNTAFEMGNSTGLIPKIGLEYTWSLNTNYVISAGFDYALNYGSNKVVFADGAGTNEKSKTKQNDKIYVAPGIVVSNDTLAYFKLGMSNYTLKADSDGSTFKTKATTLGFGLKFLAANKNNVFVEFNTVNGSNKSTVDAEGNTFDLKTKGTEMLVGYSYKF